MSVKKKAKVSKRKTQQRKPAARRTARSGSAADLEKLQAARLKAMTPAVAHRRLDRIVGTFRAQSLFWTAAGEPPLSGRGDSEHRWVLGGRFVEQRYCGEAMGVPFEGIGFTGFDNVRKKYVGSWIDTTSTGMIESLGIGQPTESEIAFVSEVHEPTGRRITFQSIVRITDRTRHSFEMWTAGPEGRGFRTLLVEYTRV